MYFIPVDNSTGFTRTDRHRILIRFKRQQSIIQLYILTILLHNRQFENKRVKHSDANVVPQLRIGDEPIDNAQILQFNIQSELKLDETRVPS